MIWNERNRRTFDSRAKTVGELVSCLEDEATSWVLARFRHISAFAATCGPVTGRLMLRSQGQTKGSHLLVPESWDLYMSGCMKM